MLFMMREVGTLVVGTDWNFVLKPLRYGHKEHDEENTCKRKES